MLKITVDFNNLTPDGEQVFVAGGAIVTGGRDTEIISQLKPGMRVLLHEPGDFEVEAIIEPPIEKGEGLVWWFATPDWSTRHDLV